MLVMSFVSAFNELTMLSHVNSIAPWHTKVHYYSVTKTSSLHMRFQSCNTISA